MKIFRASALVFLLAASASCRKIDVEPAERDRVLIYYAAGFNNISSYLDEDIEELCTKGYIPEKNSRNVLLVFRNLADGSYTRPATPELFRVYRGKKGNIIKETVFTFEPGTVAASAGTLFATLSYVRYNYPSDKYGLIFSSHATGWLPASHTTLKSRAGSSASPSSIGNEYSPETGLGIQYEMNLADFADAIPMHLDYILFDACFMGGVEVAYQLKDVCDRIAFSQAEVLADGFDYTTMATYLLRSDCDLYGVCKAYYDHYKNLTGEENSATVSLVDCNMLYKLALVCKDIFEKHRDGLSLIDPDNVQCFGRESRHMYFYDLRDIMNQLDLTREEKDSFDSALDECIIYAATTGRMINIKIDEFCGLSSYCPNKFTYDELYKTLAWNQATEMIK